MASNNATKQFHSDFARVVVNVEGVPLSLYATVDVTLVKPAKLDAASRRAWDTLKQGGTQTVTMDMIPEGGDGR